MAYVEKSVANGAKQTWVRPENPGQTSKPIISACQIDGSDDSTSLDLALVNSSYTATLDCILDAITYESNIATNAITYESNIATAP